MKNVVITSHEAENCLIDINNVPDLSLFLRLLFYVFNTKHLRVKRDLLSLVNELLI